VLNYPQLRSTWLVGFDTCTLPDVERAKHAAIMAFVVDLVMALTMFFGLLRSRGRAGGMFDLGRLLWKQVRGSDCSGGCGTFQYPNIFSIRKGVIWLLCATGAGFASMASAV
jgi:hypothetical protein